MAEGNSSKINNNGFSTEQPASGQTNIPSALTATRDSIPWLKNKFIRSAFNVIVGLLICITLYSIYVFTAPANPALAQSKIEFGNMLFSYLLYASLILLVILSIPFLLVALNTRNNSFRTIISHESHSKIQRQLWKLQLMFGAVTAYAIFFITLLWLEQSVAYFSKTVYELILVLSLFTLLLIKSVKARNIIFEYCQPDEKNNLLKIILLIPWLYGTLSFAFLFITLTTFFFPNAPGLGLVCIFFALSLIPLFGLWGIQCSFCTKEYFNLYCNREAGNMGWGIGAYQRSFYSLWIIRGLHISPIIVTYLIIAIVIISLFLPMIRILDWLGK
jgi:hypothetical protein